MARYIKKEMPDLNGTGSTKAYYRMKTSHRMEFREFVQRCHHYHALYEPSVIQGVIMAVCDQLAYELANENSVRIDGLGMFNAKIGISEYSDKKLDDSFAEGTTRRNAMSLDVTGVGYKVDKELVKNVGRYCHLERGDDERLKKSKYTLEERIELARQFLRKEMFMHVRDYARLTGLSHTTAYRELSTCRLSEAGIKSHGHKSSKVYYLAPETPEMPQE